MQLSPQIKEKWGADSPLISEFREGEVTDARPL